MAKTTQTSNKAGVKSSAKKADTTRHGNAPSPSSHAVGGAFGEEPRRGRTRVPGTASPHRGKGAALENQHGTDTSDRRTRR